MNPIARRVLVACAILGAASGAASGAPLGASLDEAQVLRLARQRAPSSQAAAGEADLADARAGRVGRHPDPSLRLEREHIAGGSEDTVALLVPLDVSGRRPTARSLARSEGRAAAASASRARRAAAVAALDAFYEALAAERRVAIARETAARLGEAASVLARRRTAGTASGLDESRFTIEAALAQSEVVEAESEVASRRSELGVVLGFDVSARRLAGAIEPPPYAASTRAFRPAELRSLQDAVDHAEAARRSARWSLLPTFSLVGGLRRVTGIDEPGYVAGLEVTLPLFDRGQGDRAEAGRTARLRAIELDGEARRRAIELTRSATMRASSLAELHRFRAATTAEVERLVRAARSAYREGQHDLAVLLDAERAAREVARRALALELAARKADTAARAARGELE